LEKIGQHSYGNLKVLRFDEAASITIGDYCSIADEVLLIVGGGEHALDMVSTYPFYERGFSEASPSTYGRGDITIGNDVWVGYGATILSGVSIGDGAVIGAQAVVREDVSPYAIVVGNPGKAVRCRFPIPVMDALLRIKWWNWEEAKIRENLPLFSDINAFIKLHDM
jgi:acetyltransferase-like isoleucine patch superfamily enzyme